MDVSCFQPASLLLNLIEFEPTVFSPPNCNLSAVFSGVCIKKKPITFFDYLMLFVSGFEQAT